MRILLIILLLGLLLYYFSRRFLMGTSQQREISIRERQNLLLIDSSSQVIRKVTQSTFTTVGIGVLLFFVILILGFKIKILWIALPLSLYLIGQFFVYTNHLKVIKEQRIYFDPEGNDIIVYYKNDQRVRFNLLRDTLTLSEVRSIQKNRGTLFGYYKLQTDKYQLFIPYLIEQHTESANRQFFDCLKSNFKWTMESRLFPII
ncbi:hypothetical protein [Sphingobacterium sp. LRF_L2]|uniref:hypothetical protein n=1 Tax=Sphingobacterium sp. LRF_L2 TaxID=3369421 RepID=UPI003F5F838E